jgi:hypothetical protein
MNCSELLAGGSANEASSEIDERSAAPLVVTSTPLMRISTVNHSLSSCA